MSVYVTQSTKPGNLVNTAQAFNAASGAAVSAKTQAVVSLLADPVFDCGTVIGRVFDDRNQDGYLDGPVTYDSIAEPELLTDDKVPRRQPSRVPSAGVPAVKGPAASGHGARTV
ncbi:MAG: hypothetical protein U5N55_13860 [Cypionkella sp.]|nr:hypothetical protein [Cypionkella sp.]